MSRVIVGLRLGGTATLTAGMRATRLGPALMRTDLERAALLQTCRTVFTAAAVLILGFGAIFQLAQPDAADPWTLRVLFAAVCVSLAISMNIIGWIRRRCVDVTAIAMYVLTAWFIFLTAFNEFAPEYGLGLLFTIAAAGFALIITQDSVKPVLVYAAFAAASVTVLVLAMRPPKPNAWLTIGAVVGIAIVIVLSSRLRTRLMAELTASEKRFRKLSEAAFEAVFITAGGRIIDCNANAVELLGHDEQDRVLGSILKDFLPSSAPQIPEHVSESDVPYRFESAIIRSDGEIIPVELRGKSASDQEQDVRVVVIRDISEQKRNEEELIVSRRRVQESLDVRNAILTNVSHEFRTPLAVILGYAELLKEQTTGDAGELGELIYESGRRLNDTLNLILELAQIEGGGFALQLEEVDVSNLVEEVVRTYLRRAELKSINLGLSVGNDDNFAHVDRVRVQKTIDYLLDNAVKYTDAGSIEVAVSSDEKYIYVAVVDTGQGIDDTFRPELFKPFKQESSGLTRRHGGLGVGLAIARYMTECMGGSIEVASKKGAGSSFTVALPRSPASEPQSQAVL